VYKAVDALRRELEIRPGVEIDLRKKISRRPRLGGGLERCCRSVARIPEPDPRKNLQRAPYGNWPLLSVPTYLFFSSEAARWASAA